jgi:hypothetical protein
MARLPARRRAGHRHSAGRVRRCVLAVNHVAAGRMRWWWRGLIIAVVAIAVAITIMVVVVAIAVAITIMVAVVTITVDAAANATGANSARAGGAAKPISPPPMLR